MNVLLITPVFAALFGLLFVVFTLRVGLYRRAHKISLGDGNDPVLRKRIRAHANFVESVPLAIILIAFVELSGATQWLVVCTGLLLFLARLSHYLQVSGLIQPLGFRIFGMLGTFAVYITASLWLLKGVLI